MLTAAQKAKYNNEAPVEGLAGLVQQKLGCLKAIWDASVDGGAAGGTYTLKDEDGKAVVIPPGAIITWGYIDVITPLVNDGAGEFAIDFIQGGSPTTLLQQQDMSGISGIISAAQNGSTNTMLKLTDLTLLQVSTVFANFTAGKLVVFLEFVISET